MKFSKIDKITGYHRGIPYSNSLFAWEDNYNIEFNNNMYYIKLKTHYSFGRMRLTDISGELRNQQYKRSQLPPPNAFGV